MIYITRKFHFSASHKLHNPKLSEDDNIKRYGKCANPNGHGHNYILDVTIAGEIDEGLGYVMDLSEVKEIVNREVIDKVDHKNLNMDVDFMKNVLPSTENIVIKFWEQVVEKLKRPNCRLYLMRLEETLNNSVEYRGE